MPDPFVFLDAHLDIAWNKVQYNRDFLMAAADKRALESGKVVEERNGQSIVGLPDLLRGRFAVVFGTIFTAPDWAVMTEGDQGYATPQQAHQQGMEQLDYYHRLADSDPRIVLIQTTKDLADVLATWTDDAPEDSRKLGILAALENSDPIREPRSFYEWYERGVRSVGIAWGETRYSGGTPYKGRGNGPLTDLGRELLDQMANLNAILDLSHISAAAFPQALDRYEGQVICSHSNPRTFRDTERHLTDDMIRRLADHNGVIGLVPYNNFLRSDYKPGEPRALTPLTRYIDVIDYVCQLTGSAAHVGIGSDYDGGFGLGQIPEGLESIADLPQIVPLLRERGYSESDIQDIAGGNFLRILRATLP